MPVIIVTGSGDEEVAVMMMKAGASDYLVKGNINAEILERSIKDALERYEKFDNSLAKQNEVVLKYMAIKNALNGVCVVDLNGSISYVNGAFLHMLGYAEDKDIQQKNIRELFLEPRKLEEIFNILQAKKSWFGEVAGLKRSQGEIYLQALFSLIEYKENKPAQIMGSFIDITNIRDAEKKRDALYKGIMEVFALRAEEVGNVETAGHIHRIAAYVRYIAQQLSQDEPFKNYIDEKYINDVSYASMLHDVGKWRTPNEILLKPGNSPPRNGR